jgi:hypothetical protein
MVLVGSSAVYIPVDDEWVNTVTGAGRRALRPVRTALCQHLGVVEGAVQQWCIEF